MYGQLSTRLIDPERGVVGDARMASASPLMLSPSDRAQAIYIVNATAVVSGQPR